MKGWLRVAIVVLLCMVSGPALRPAGAASSAAEASPPTAATPAPGTPAPMTDIHDIRPPVPVGIDLPWRVALLAAAAAVLLAVLWWWWSKRRRPAAIETIVPELPPEMVAMQALDRIGDVHRLDGKVFYFRLSAILRQYVLGRYGVGAPEMTTEEFVPCIDRLPIDQDSARRLVRLCRAMDPVKFGGLTAEARQMEDDLFFIRGFVRQTTRAAGIGEDAAASEPLDEPFGIEKNSKQQISTLK